MADVHPVYTLRFHTHDGTAHDEGEVYDAPIDTVETLYALTMARPLEVIDPGHRRAAPVKHDPPPAARRKG